MGRKSSPNLQGRVMEPLTTAPVYVGIDVAKEWLDVHILPSNQCLLRDDLGESWRQSG
jgi:hypothetical protein